MEAAFPMDKPTLRVLHGVPTSQVRLDGGLTPDDLDWMARRLVAPQRRDGRPSRALRHLYVAIVGVLETVRTGRPRRLPSSVVAAEDRLPL